jgi:adenosylcobinamide-phosphate synthase
MISLIWQIWIALALDLLIGDPRWLPHPVRLMGRMALALEAPARRYVRNEKFAGILVALCVIMGSVLAGWIILFVSRSLSPMVGDIVSIWILFTTMAAKDLGIHSRRVLKALESGDLAGARVAVSHMVGRDTEALDEAGVVRAAVESVAENTVDGVLAPLFFAALLGPLGALAFKAISTLDSTFGYKNARYRNFGWASARLDDVANFIPARLSPLLIGFGALFAGGRPGGAVSMGFRDARKHASPNAGFPEACFAGALGVQLGGPVIRGGVAGKAPLLGDPEIPLGKSHISRANALMAAATLSAAALFTGLRVLMEAIVHVG